MGNIYRLGRGMQRADVPVNAAKNNLPIGAVLQLVGYDNPRYCVIKNLGITESFESYGAKYKVINVETGQESIKDALSLDHISKKDVEIRGIHTYFTDTVLSPDEIMDLINKSATKKTADIKAKAEADQTKALELKTLKRNYAHLVPVIGNKRSTYAIGAANIRKELKVAYPGVKFSVTSEGYSQGCSIDIFWVDAVTTEDVEKIINKYEYGTFDSMTDCAGSIGSQFIDLYGGARFVKANRHLSDVAYNAVAAKMGYPEAVFNARQGDFDGVDNEISQMIKREARNSKF